MSQNKIAELYSKSDSIQSYARSYIDHLHEVMGWLDLDAFSRAVEVFREARHSDKALYIIGNGGSAAIAAHLVNDLVAGAYQEDAPAFRAFSLVDNLATVTALGNDEGYESIFERQLKVFLKPGDVVLAMSVSGNSPNIIRAIEYSRSHGATTVGMCGLTGGQLAKICDIVLYLNTTLDEYGPVEDAFGILCHILSGYLAMKQGKMLHH